MAGIERQFVAEGTLLGILIDGTTKALGRDASLLGAKIVFCRCEGEPDWDVEPLVVGNYLMKAFTLALKDAKDRYNLDPSHPFRLMTRRLMSRRRSQQSI